MDLTGVEVTVGSGEELRSEGHAIMGEDKCSLERIRGV
jgi:hypothetical protein